MKRLLLILMLGVMPLVGMAAPPATEGMDPAMAERFKALTAELRCLVCQNQTLLDSPSEFAADMRREVRELMVDKGMTDREIIDYLVARYGDFIRYRPPFKSTTALLWFGPFILIVVGASALFIHIRRRRALVSDNGTTLSPEEQQRVQSLLKGGGDDKT